MRRRRGIGLIPLDLEIEKTAKTRRRERRIAAATATADMAGNIPALVAVGGNNQAPIADDRNRALREYALPVLQWLNPGIVQPTIEAQHFEHKLVMFQMLQTVGQFNGLPTEDPHLHLRLFMEVCDSFKQQGVIEEALRLKLFPFSLRDRARAWLNTLPPDSIRTWNELAEKFLMKYFPPTKTAKLRNDITSFRQFEGESLYEAWERFKELLRKCPHHGIPHHIQMETFYNGLDAQTRNIVDASANGAILSKTYNEAYDILERMATNNYQWPTERASTRKVAGVHELDAVTALTAQVSSLTSALKSLNLATEAKSQQCLAVSCVYCGGEHAFEGCPSNPESTFYVGNFNRDHNPHSNTYNSRWRQHPNFSWNNTAQNAAASGPARPQQPPGFSQNAAAFQQQARPQYMGQTSSIESLLKEYMSQNVAYRSKTDAIIQSQAASLRNLENQMGQLASALSNRPQGALPSDTENPRHEGKEHCKLITLRSGKELSPPKQELSTLKEPITSQEKEENEDNMDAQRKQKADGVSDATASDHHSIAAEPVAAALPQHNSPDKQLETRPPPFPQRFYK